MIPVRSIFKYSCSTESKSNILHKSESTLNTIVISGTALQWYDLLEAFYLIQLFARWLTYASQTENGCEAQINLPSPFPYQYFTCK
jgi:hypothetical protein